MPPRYAYWTILAGGLPTAFRAAERDELLPTFKRIQEKHPDAEMKYFARGKLWDSREAAQAAYARASYLRQDSGQSGRRASGAKAAGRPEGDRRGRDWRPGGEHRDPRQQFKDAKKERNVAWRKERFDRKNRPPREQPHGDPLRRQSRPFAGLRFEQKQGSEESQAPPRPHGPNREPRPGEIPKPAPLPRPGEPSVPPPGPPERGRGAKRRFPPRGRPPKNRGPRR